MNIKGGYRLVEFDSDADFTNIKEITNLLKAGTGLTPKDVNEDFADGTQRSALKQMDVAIRSANVDDGAGSAYALLKAAEEARTKLHFRFVSKSRGVVVEDCEAAWDELVAENVTATADTDDKKVGTASAKFVVGADVAEGTILATQVVEVDLSDRKSLTVWIKSSVQADAGDLQLLLDDSQECGSPLELLDIPALAANTWTKCDLPLSNPAALSAVISVGLKMVTDLGACTIHLDDVRAVEDNVVVHNVVPFVDFEDNEAGKHNAIRVTGTGAADTEDNLLDRNY
jgi:hypothetical protein